MNDFDEQICQPVRDHLGRGVRLPSVGSWHVGRDRGAPVLGLTIGSEALGANLQTNGAASPFFLLCFAYWWSRQAGVDPTLRLEVTRGPPEAPSALRHYRRAWLVLEALQHALGDRLEVVGSPAQRWPERPVLNAPKVERATHTTGGGREHQVEVQLTRDPALAASFSTRFMPIDAFHRQLPLGLFDGEVAERARWTPGSGAQADLWATSPDLRTFHLFELKVEGNSHVGVLPELLVYCWLLHRVRHGLDDGTPILGGGPGIHAVREAERIVGWIVAPSVHPLLLHAGRSPMEWLTEGLRDDLSFGMAFYTDLGGPSGFGGWLPERTWRSSLR